MRPALVMNTIEAAGGLPLCLSASGFAAKKARLQASGRAILETLGR
jgi:hypothetical protein